DVLQRLIPSRRPRRERSPGVPFAEKPPKPRPRGLFCPARRAVQPLIARSAAGSTGPTLGAFAGRNVAGLPDRPDLARFLVSQYRARLALPRVRIATPRVLGDKECVLFIATAPASPVRRCWCSSVLCRHSRRP